MSRSAVNIVLKKSKYVPGENVEGAAFLYTGMNVPVRVNVEVFCWEITSSKENELRSGMRKLFSIERELVPTARLAKGTTYYAPFSFVLPSGIPDSYSVNGDKGSAKICYSVNVCRDFSRGDDFDYENSEKEFIVENKVPKPTEYLQPFDSEKEEGPIEVRVMTWCCIYKGSILGNVQLNQSGFKPGEKVRMHINLSQSKKDIIKNKKTIKFEFGSVVQISGCSSLGTDMSVSWPDHINYALIDSKELVRNNEDSYYVEFEVPKEAESTIIGSLSRRMHFIKVCLETNGTFYTDMYCLVPVLRTKEDEEHSVEPAFEARVAALCNERPQHIKLNPLEIQLPSHLNIGNDPLGLMEGRTLVPRKLLDLKS
jgi:hypothetical protein